MDTGFVDHRDIARRYGISLRLVEKQITRAKAAIREIGWRPWRDL